MSPSLLVPMLLAFQEAPEGDAAVGGAIVGLVCCFYVFLGIFGIATFAFWLWMLIDCIKHEPSEGNDKLIWILVIVLTGGLGALIYFFVRRPKRKSQYGS